MCYFLYGAVNDGINSSDYDSAAEGYDFHFKIGTESDVNNCVSECDIGFRITDLHCDCGTAIGSKQTSKKELSDFAEFLKSLRKVRGIKHIFLSKNWALEENEKEKTVHIDDIDLINFLANIEVNCLYKIELYKRYY